MAPLNDLRIAVVGGVGHVGLPLSLTLADRGFPVVAIDNDTAKIRRVEDSHFPFREEGGEELLRRTLATGRISFTDRHAAVEQCGVVIVTIGTPIDEHMNPDLRPVFSCIEELRPHLSPGTVIILRSTLFPGTSERIHELLVAAGLRVGVSFCPERIVEGRALEELPRIPQIISGTDSEALAVARAVFSAITPTIVELPLVEAEIAKLFSNAWRYIKFAVANQFYAMVEERGLDFHRIRDAMMRDYSRAADFPAAGFTAGPCLFKDTMQLAAFSRQQFALGHAAMLVNETLPDFVVEQARRHGPLRGRTVGILGMAFKAESDDTRESLAYKLRRLLQYEGAVVLCTDPYVADPAFLPLGDVVSKADLLVIGCPHAEYRRVQPGGKAVIDCWGLTRTSG